MLHDLIQCSVCVSKTLGCNHMAVIILFAFGWCADTHSLIHAHQHNIYLPLIQNDGVPLTQIDADSIVNIIYCAV